MLFGTFSSETGDFLFNYVYIGESPFFWGKTNEMVYNDRKFNEEFPLAEIYESLDVNIREHLKLILKSSGLEQDDKSLESLASAWKEKEESFTKQIERMDMVETETIGEEENCGFMVLTYSGSLIGSGPQTDEGRTVLYVSVGLRKDVPEKAEKEGSKIKGAIRKGEPVEFSVGPVKQSSPAYRIARITDKIAIEDQSEKISEATLVIAEEFIDVNKTIIL